MIKIYISIEFIHYAKINEIIKASINSFTFNISAYSDDKIHRLLDKFALKILFYICSNHQNHYLIIKGLSKRLRYYAKLASFKRENCQRL